MVRMILYEFLLYFRGPLAKAIFLQQAEVAQLVEQLICNQQVAGSTPFFGS